MPQPHLLISQCHQVSHISENFVCSTTSQSCNFLPNKCALPSNKVWKCSLRFFSLSYLLPGYFPSASEICWYFFLHESCVSISTYFCSLLSVLTRFPILFIENNLFTFHLNKTFDITVLIEVKRGRSLANQHFKLRGYPSPLTRNLSNIH